MNIVQLSIFEEHQENHRILVHGREYRYVNLL